MNDLLAMITYPESQVTSALTQQPPLHASYNMCYILCNI